MNAKMERPNAKIVGHPECRPDVQDCADFLGSSMETIAYCEQSKTNEFLVADEVGSLDVLKMESPINHFILFQSYGMPRYEKGEIKGCVKRFRKRKKQSCGAKRDSGKCKDCN